MAQDVKEGLAKWDKQAWEAGMFSTRVKSDYDKQNNKKKVMKYRGEWYRERGDTQNYLNIKEQNKLNLNIIFYTNNRLLSSTKFQGKMSNIIRVSKAIAIKVNKIT